MSGILGNAHFLIKIGSIKGRRKGGVRRSAPPVRPRRQDDEPPATTPRKPAPAENPYAPKPNA
jgi:hypothetical protein